MEDRAPEPAQVDTNLFPPEAGEGRRSPLPLTGGGVFPSQEAQGVSAGRGGLRQPGLWAWTPSSFLFRAWGEVGVSLGGPLVGI